MTSKAAGNNQKIPMCGVPHRAYLSYVSKLIDKGYKVGIVEQLEDPKLAKDIVQRDVIQIISPGANLELKDDTNNFIGALTEFDFSYILAFADLSTGEQYVTNIDHDYRSVLAMLSSLGIKEVVVSTSFDAGLINFLKEHLHVVFSYNNNDEIDIDMENFFVYLKDVRQMSCVAKLYNYLVESQKRKLDYFQPVINRLNKKVLGLSYSTRVDLELTRSSASQDSYGSLFWLLNKTSTSMGARLLKNYIEEPSCDLSEILSRQNQIQDLLDNFMVRGDLKDNLASIYDLDRLIGRVGFNSCTGREMLQLKKSLMALPFIKSCLDSVNSSNFKKIYDDLGNFEDLVELLEKAIDVDCPMSTTEGHIFKKGYNAELDELIEISGNGKDWLLNIEEKEKARTGIKNLKVGYNRVFGYYIEISNSNLSSILPEYGYIRKQTLTNGERFITEDLKQAESKLLNAEQNRILLEQTLFQELRKVVASYSSRIQLLGKAIAKLDVLVSLAEVACEGNYIRPVFNSQRKIEIIEGRHPVIEKVLPNKDFISNDYIMDEKTDVLIITGPNMGGKSTYMREFALLVIMAQMGSFVPAKKANLYLFDSIFTRIGASDDLIKGQSTFMVEMSDCNYALRNATSESLILFDEIGRGTSTYDGIALAQAILEYLIEHVHAKTLFSTHYHEITSLVSHLDLIKNVHVSVSEENGKVTFLYKVVDGPMDKSYGINVASLANLPETLIKRSKVILSALENKKQDFTEIKETIKEKSEAKDELRLLLKKLDPLQLSPLEALNFLFELKRKSEEDE